MGKQIYTTGSPSGDPIDNNYYRTNRGMKDVPITVQNGKTDRDLIIEDNTVYEIDRECYERMKRQKKYKSQDKRTGN